jgi:hypothetical protein
MSKRIFALFGLAISLFGTQCWAQCEENCPPSVTNTFSPGTTEGIYNFAGDGTLIVDFVTVLTTFSLTVTVNPTLDPLDPNVFPPGTVCVKYSTSANPCDQYDFTGNKGGPNGVPVRKIDYNGLITLTLTYSTNQTVHNPAFGHAPGDNTTAVYSEDILTNYFTSPITPEPGMGGKTPGLSSVAALDEPLEETDCFVLVSPTEGQVFTVGQEIEVEFQLSDSTSCPGNPGNPERDKDARLSLSRSDNGKLVFVPVGKDEGGKHFHFDHQEGVNEREVDTEGLQPGTYVITVFSDEFSPQSRTVVINP